MDFEAVDNCYTLNLWVETKKSPQEFVDSLSHVLSPIPIKNGKFELGQIMGEIAPFLDFQSPVFEGIPKLDHGFRVGVDIVDYNIWGGFDREFFFSLCVGMRTRFHCRYQVTAEMDFFILFSGTNLSQIANKLYPPFALGELNQFMQAKCQWLSIP